MLKLLLLGLWAWCLVVTAAASSSSDLSSPFVEEFSCGHLYYRRLHLPPHAHQHLYVGAMDHLFRLNPANVSQSECERDGLHLPASNVANCVSKGKSEDKDCRNHVRVIQSIDPDNERLYICGTNAHSPRDQVLYANLTRLARHEFYPGVGDGLAKCPFDPEDNSTAVWVSSGNPGGHPAIYSGTNAEFTKADTVIFRGDIFDVSTGRREYTFKRTIKYDSHMLDQPDFVGSYDVGEYVYFFFRETAVEHLSCGRVVYSRVARVCKRDVGGKNILHQNWATYLKARLNCSLPGDFPFFFNEIQDVFKSEDDDSVFHAVFTTTHNGLTGSAVCSFHLDDLQATFEGKFKEQATSTSVWLPVPKAKVPEPRPGRCLDDTRQLPDTVLNFIRKHPLMDQDVPHDARGPAFHLRDVMFTKLVVDVVNVAGNYGSSSRAFTVYYAATEDGRLYKVSRWTDGQGRHHSKLLDVLDVTSPDPVRAMAISREHKSLYVSSDYAVKQVRLELCAARYANCAQCVRDPYCGWDRESSACKPRHFSYLQDPAGEAGGVCEMSTPTEKLTTNFGQSVHLACGLNSAASGSDDGDVYWFHQDNKSGHRRRLVRLDASKHVLTRDHGLVIIGTTERDAGHYECHLGRQLISSYHLAVDAHRCAAPNKTADYQKVYSDWCHQYQKYKDALKSWEKRQNKCAAVTAETLLARRNQVYSAAAAGENPYV